MYAYVHSAVFDYVYAHTLPYSIIAPNFLLFLFRPSSRELNLEYFFPFFALLFFIFFRLSGVSTHNATLNKTSWTEPNETITNRSPCVWLWDCCAGCRSGGSTRRWRFGSGIPRRGVRRRCGRCSFTCPSISAAPCPTCSRCAWSCWRFRSVRLRRRRPFDACFLV